ncbi:glycoside hydrolase family 47 protein [Roridomyces roridus]|uniref:alpha-1,2-Mannosidase n=1 Tax=Roridomyces roridus TaxID=1738132 RepID=A0AAD7FKS2_9AGAR|nr:glycoside hydrolase family 47 protein [Roridomyces roridus]
MSRFSSPYLRLQKGSGPYTLYRKPIIYSSLSILVLFLLFRQTYHPRNVVLESHVVAPPPEIWDDRAAAVKRAFLHAYSGYEQYAAPHDELRPMSDSYINNFNGWGVTAVDSLDTMLLMKLDDEYARALAQVSNIRFDLPTQTTTVSYFETVIRYLGGFLSAYALSADHALLTLAEELAIKLDPVFNNYGGVFPVSGVNTQTGYTSGGEIASIAEMGTLQMEYLYLAKATGNKRWFDRANGVMQAFAKADLSQTGGMMPVKWNLTSLTPYDTHLSVAGEGDSAHEYLLKQYLLTAKTDQKSLEMYIRATTHILTNLLYVSSQRNMLYVTDTDTATFEHPGRPKHNLDHLACFLPGLLALGVHTLPLDDLQMDLKALGEGMGWATRGYTTLARQPSLREMHLWAATGLAETCYTLYADQPTGLGPEGVQFRFTGSPKWGPDANGTWADGGGRRWIDEVEAWRAAPSLWSGRALPPGVTEDAKPIVWTEEERRKGGVRRDYGVRMTSYLLRPETVESLYIMWRVTGETRWREMGWQIFEAIERETRTESGYASVASVEVVGGFKSDSMPSYFLAETLKYLYLLFVNDDPVPLDSWVFNTEAHPFPVFQWTQSEKDHFGIV